MLIIQTFYRSPGNIKLQYFDPTCQAKYVYKINKLWTGVINKMLIRSMLLHA